MNFATCAPSDLNHYHFGPDWHVLLQVPFRRVHLQEANGHFDLYDTSGEQVGQKHAD